MARRCDGLRFWVGGRASMRVIRVLALPLVAGLAPAANLVHARTPPAPIITTTFAVSPHAASSGPDSLTRSATVIRPCLSMWADGLSFGLGSVAALAARAISPDIREVPPTGLDRSGIRLGVDRRSIHTRNDRSLRWSDRSVTAAVALPAVLALARDPVHPDPRGRGPSSTTTRGAVPPGLQAGTSSRCRRDMPVAPGAPLRSPSSIIYTAVPAPGCGRTPWSDLWPGRSRPQPRPCGCGAGCTSRATF